MDIACAMQSRLRFDEFFLFFVRDDFLSVCKHKLRRRLTSFEFSLEVETMKLGRDYIISINSDFDSKVKFEIFPNFNFIISRFISFRSNVLLVVQKKEF